MDFEYLILFNNGVFFRKYFEIKVRGEMRARAQATLRLRSSRGIVERLGAGGPRLS